MRTRAKWLSYIKKDVPPTPLPAHYRHLETFFFFLQLWGGYGPGALLEETRSEGDACRQHIASLYIAARSEPLATCLQAANSSARLYGKIFSW
jgi:hypothetical protein